jgi:hypothetical protein
VVKGGPCQCRGLKWQEGWLIGGLLLEGPVTSWKGSGLKQKGRRGDMWKWLEGCRLRGEAVTKDQLVENFLERGARAVTFW